MNFIRNTIKRLAALQRDMLLFISAVAAVGLGESVFNAVFNNFLSETFTLNDFYRTFLELPRESGGLLVIVVSAALFFIRSRRLAALATLLGATGLILMSCLSFTFHWMFAWLFIFSLGQHLFMPLNTSIGMELAKEGMTGRRLGQFNAIRNVALIAGSFLVFIGFKYLHFNFRLTFFIAALFFLAGAVCLYSMHPGDSHPAKVHLKFHREYRLYYWLTILYGTRKQIFLTFAPWVLVTVFHKPTAVIATLLTIAGVVGILFQPILGRAIDTIGEKKILAMEAFLLIFVCLGYGYAKTFFTENSAFIIASVCFIADQLLMSVNMARSTYLKKIIVNKEHLTPTLSMSVSLDHVFSISVALLGGILWTAWGYQAVFVMGAGVAIINLVSAQFIRIPEKERCVMPR